MSKLLATPALLLALLFAPAGCDVEDGDKPAPRDDGGAPPDDLADTDGEDDGDAPPDDLAGGGDTDTGTGGDTDGEGPGCTLGASLPPVVTGATIGNDC